MLAEAFVDWYRACVRVSISCGRVDQITWNLSLKKTPENTEQNITNILLKTSLSLEEDKGTLGAKNENETENYNWKPENQEIRNNMSSGLSSLMLDLQLQG